MKIEQGIEVRAADLSQFDIGTIRAKYNASGTDVLRYYIDIRHKVLHLHKDISAPDLYILENKVNSIIATYEQKYEHHLRRQNQEDKKQQAIDLTEDANELRSQLRRILEATLSVDDTVDWNILKSDKKYKMKSFEPLAEPSRGQGFSVDMI